MERALGLLQPCRVTGSVFGVHGKKLRREVLLGVFRNDPANPVVFDDDFAIVQVVAQDGNAGLDVFEQFVGHAEPIVQAQVLGADDAHICAGGVAQQIGIGNWGVVMHMRAPACDLFAQALMRAASHQDEVQVRALKGFKCVEQQFDSTTDGQPALIKEEGGLGRKVERRPEDVIGLHIDRMGSIEDDDGVLHPVQPLILLGDALGHGDECGGPPQEGPFYQTNEAALDGVFPVALGLILVAVVDERQTGPGEFGDDPHEENFKIVAVPDVRLPVFQNHPGDDFQVFDGAKQKPLRERHAAHADAIDGDAVGVIVFWNIPFQQPHDLDVESGLLQRMGGLVHPIVTGEIVEDDVSDSRRFHSVCRFKRDKVVVA